MPVLTAVTTTLTLAHAVAACVGLWLALQ
jgi:hypothetical protein